MNRPARLLQIVPALPPSIEGVSATAQAIALALGERNSAECAFAVPTHSGLTIDETGAPEPDVVLVHYVNYAYHPHGCPERLICDVERWSREHPGRVWTYFHEVYASGKPWQRTFWLSSRQRRLAGRLAAASTYCLTSLPLYASMLRELGYSGALATVPISSTIGEPDSVPVFGKRAAQLAIFGSRGRRAMAFEREGETLLRACAALRIERILDIGDGDVAPTAIGNIPIRRAGALPAKSVSELLQESRAGFVSYPLDYLGKSSIFAAYTSHGALAVCSGRPRTRHEEPIAGEHFWDASRPAPQEVARIAGNGRAWYSRHSMSALVDLLEARLPPA